MLLLAWLTACAHPDPFADVDVPELRQCLGARCADAADPTACREAECALTEASWALHPERIAYDGTVAYIETAVEHEPARYGDVVVPRTEPVFVGVTLIRDSGEELDLAVQTRFDSNLEAPFFLSADVGPGVTVAILGLWDHKVEPCEVDRPGCREFGFVLDGPLASWPPNFYSDFRSQRIPPQHMEIRVNTAGAPVDQATAARDAGLEAARSLLAPFETTLPAQPVRLAAEAVDTPTLSYGYKGDELLARTVAAAMAESLGADVAITQRPDSAARLEVTLPGPHLACLQEHCADAAYLAPCAQEHCAPE